MSALDDAVISRRQVLQGAGGLLAATMLGGIVGCGSSSGSGDTTTVSAWIYRPEYRKAIDKILDEFHKAHPNISVDMAYKPTGQYPTILKTALVGGSGPDAIATNGANGIWGDLGADGGYIVPLDGKIDVDALSSAARNAVTYKGHVYGAPVQMFRIGVYYQKPIFQKYGLQEPRTWEELTALSKKLADNGVEAWSMPAQDMIIPFFFYHLAVNSILGKDSEKALASGQVKLTDPNLVRAAQYMLDMSKYFNKGFQAVAYAEGKALFAQGRTAMTIGGSSDYAGYVEVDPNVDVGFFGFPSPKGEMPPNALNGLSMAYSVNAKATDKAAATTFVSWLDTKPAQEIVLANLGLPAIEGLRPTGDTPRDKVLSTILAVDDTPSWLDYPATGSTMTAAMQDGGGVFTGKLSAEQFAAVVQKSITPNAG
jgi:raffinose/stachyose/melibiose transport system substrate-binding protein